jgi:hypothetical protein
MHEACPARYPPGGTWVWTVGTRAKFRLFLPDGIAKQLPAGAAEGCDLLMLYLVHAGTSGDDA